MSSFARGPCLSSSTQLYCAMSRSLFDGLYNFPSPTQDVQEKTFQRAELKAELLKLAEQHAPGASFHRVHAALVSSTEPTLTSNAPQTRRASPRSRSRLAGPPRAITDLQATAGQKNRLKRMVALARALQELETQLFELHLDAQRTHSPVRCVLSARCSSRSSPTYEMRITARSAV